MRTTNEWEFQGEALRWINSEIDLRPGMGLDRATQEPSKITPKRNDLVVWIDRAAETAFLTIELKTPTTSISDPGFLNDACEKAQRWSAPFFAIWNMQSAELYPTPDPPATVTPADHIHSWPVDPLVSTVEDWLKPKPQESLKACAIAILDKAWEHHTTSGTIKLALDATIFVDRLARQVSTLRAQILVPLRKLAATKKTVRTQLREIAAAQGFLGFVDDINTAVAGQYAYRLIGQILFYFALRRKQSTLKPLTLSAADDIPKALRPYWDDVRRFDYEALFQPNVLDDLVPLPPSAQHLVRALIQDLSRYDWNELREDVLGAIFERLIPRDEQLLLGQFYTPSQVADVLISFSDVDESPDILDPGCGSGTFLLRAYDFLRRQQSLSHEAILSALWGFDISAFAAELAAINLYRQNFAAFDNFPRIVPGDFFERDPGEEVPFPPAKSGPQKKVVIPIPTFDAVVGNPPYLRSQNQDDLSPKYRERLFTQATKSGINAPAKTDLFAFFLYKALQFLSPKGRLGFVTSASWTTAVFGAPIQRLLLDRLRLVALVASEAESFFSQVAINTVLVVAELRDKRGLIDDEMLRFVTLKKRLEDLFPHDADYWDRVCAFTDEVEAATESKETSEYRINVVPAAPEKAALDYMPAHPRNWSVYLRAPVSYFQLFAGD